jgi:hypothetical protein
MSGIAPITIRNVAIAGAVVLAAACAQKVAPPPPPPPPQVERIPARPIPPGGASYTMAIPPLGIDGQRLTVNRGLSDDEKVWHFRSAWNVAALNCTAPQYQPITDAYGNFIKKHSRALSQVNSRIDKSYQGNHRSKRDAIRAREEKMTSVYNFFALPPARTEFCLAALNLANYAASMPGYDPIELATNNLKMLEAPFDNFFSKYEEYQRESAAWDARYGARYGMSQPGYVAVYGSRAAPQVGTGDPANFTLQPTTPAGTVTDPETGARIPVVPVPEGEESVPIVQPIPTADGPSGG